MSMSQYATLEDYIKDRFPDNQLKSTLSKPTVHYVPNVLEDYIEIGRRASVYAVDHPHLGQQGVWTSNVLSFDASTGVFETMNTIYKPVDTLH